MCLERLLCLTIRPEAQYKRHEYFSISGTKEAGNFPQICLMKKKRLQRAVCQEERPYRVAQRRHQSMQGKREGEGEGVAKRVPQRRIRHCTTIQTDKEMYCSPRKETLFKNETKMSNLHSPICPASKMNNKWEYLWTRVGTLPVKISCLLCTNQPTRSSVCDCCRALSERKGGRRAARPSLSLCAQTVWWNPDSSMGPRFIQEHWMLQGVKIQEGTKTTEFHDCVSGIHKLHAQRLLWEMLNCWEREYFFFSHFILFFLGYFSSAPLMSWNQHLSQFFDQMEHGTCTGVLESNEWKLSQPTYLIETLIGYCSVPVQRVMVRGMYSLVKIIQSEDPALPCSEIKRLRHLATFTWLAL